MRKLMLLLMAVLAVSWGVSAEAAPVYEGWAWAANIDGTYSLQLNEFIALPGGGSGVATITGSGDHYVGLFIDYDISTDVDTFFNEFGATSGAPAAGQSWEIDLPGYWTGASDINTNLKSGTLDNTNSVADPARDDVSMALAWNFSLTAGQTADVTFHLSTTAPASGFYLSQTNPAGEGGTFYFWSTLEIGGGEVPVPEPATLLLMGSGLGALVLLRKRMQR